MNVELIHNITKTIRVVSEHTDLLFNDGWRFGRHISNSYNQNEIDLNNEDMFHRIQQGYCSPLDQGY